MELACLKTPKEAIPKVISFNYLSASLLFRETREPFEYGMSYEINNSQPGNNELPQVQIHFSDIK